MVPAQELIQSATPIMREMFEKTPVLGDFAQETWAAAWMKLLFCERGNIFLRKQGDEVVGILTATVADDFNTGDTKAFVTNCYVRKENAGAFHAEALLHQAEEWAKQRGAKYLFFDYMDANRPTSEETLTRLFGGLGYEPDSRVYRKEL